MQLMRKREVLDVMSKEGWDSSMSDKRVMEAAVTPM